MFAMAQCSILFSKTTYHYQSRGSWSHSCSQYPVKSPIHLLGAWTVGGSQRTRREPTQTGGEHASFTEKNVPARIWSLLWSDSANHCSTLHCLVIQMPSVVLNVAHTSKLCLSLFSQKAKLILFLILTLQVKSCYLIRTFKFYLNCDNMRNKMCKIVCHQHN